LSYRGIQRSAHGGRTDCDYRDSCEGAQHAGGGDGPVAAGGDALGAPAGSRQRAVVDYRGAERRRGSGGDRPAMSLRGPVAQWWSRGLIIPWLQVRILPGPPHFDIGASPRAGPGEGLRGPPATERGRDCSGWAEGVCSPVRRRRSSSSSHACCWSPERRGRSWLSAPAPSVHHSPRLRRVPFHPTRSLRWTAARAR
jgi:hypothetical protein